MLCACIKSSAYFVNPPLRHGGKPHGGKLLKGRGVKRNSSSCYLRTLRTLYRKAVETGLTTDKHIFRHVFTGFAKTAKRAIPLSSLRAIRLLRLPKDSVIAFARDLFMLSVYLQGISFVDLAYLKKDSPYLLPIITKAEGTERRQYERMEHKVNYYLKKISAMAGLRTSLTTYTGRHTWASAMRDMGTSLSVISKGLGHENLKTTQIYLSSIDTEDVVKANRKMIGKIMRE